MGFGGRRLVSPWISVLYLIHEDKFRTPFELSWNLIIISDYKMEPVRRRTCFFRFIAVYFRSQVACGVSRWTWIEKGSFFWYCDRWLFPPEPTTSLLHGMESSEWRENRFHCVVIGARRMASARWRYGTFSSLSSATRNRIWLRNVWLYHFTGRLGQSWFLLSSPAKVR